MEKAIQHFGHALLDGTEHVHDGRQPEFEYPLSPDILAMTRVYANHQPAHHLLATKGAPEAVMELCHLSAEQRQTIARQVESMAERGLRVLGVARGVWREPGGQHDPETDWPGSQHDFEFEYLGLVALYDPPRPEVHDAINMCDSASNRQAGRAIFQS
jgi:Ca2+-transporting ATPase